MIELALGNTTAPNEASIVNWYSTGAVSTSLGIPGLTTGIINKCQTYYPKIRARDDAGNTSVIPHVLTTGFKWDPDAPTFAGAVDVSANNQTRQHSPTADWSAIAATDNCTLANYKVALGTGTAGAALNDVADWVTLPTAQTSYRFADSGQGAGFYLALNTNYYIHVKAVDSAGNETMVSSPAWQVNPTAVAYPRAISNTGVSEAGATTVQTIVCEIPHGVNRLLAVSVNKDSANTTSVVSMTAGSNNVPLNFVIGQDQAHNSGWRTRGEIWVLNDNLATGIPSIAEVPASTSITINVTWTATSSDKIATCQVFDGVNQTTPISNSADNELAQNASANNITLNNFAEAANSTSFVSCHHGNPVGAMAINQGTNDALQTTVQGSMINTVNENRGAGTLSYLCTSDSSWRRVIMGINVNGD